MSKPFNKILYKMHHSLMNVSVFNGHKIYTLFVPKHIYIKYEESSKREMRNKNISSMDKTRLDGYLNPYYRAATSPRKCIR